MYSNIAVEYIIQWRYLVSFIRRINVQMVKSASLSKLFCMCQKPYSKHRDLRKKKKKKETFGTRISSKNYYSSQKNCS